MSGQGTVATDAGERLMLPAELWQAIDDGVAIARDYADPVECRTAFAGAFAKALHARGLILVPRARSDSRETVAADIYSLALAGKYDAERRLKVALDAQPALAGIMSLLLGSAGSDGTRGSPLLDDFSGGILALAGRAPPADLHLVLQAMTRLRGIAAIAAGIESIGDIPPLPDALVEFLSPPPEPGAGEAIR